MDDWGVAIDRAAAWPAAVAAQLGARTCVVICDRASCRDGAWALHSGDHSPLCSDLGQPTQGQQHGDPVHRCRLLAGCFGGFLVGAGSG